ncbi:MAG TPA: hypothetical protein VNU25_01825 [Candidatus Paceibacterota bacterium]|nr:hypothetical protein [Candidatus Paceibacterota bacterium]
MPIEFNEPEYAARAVSQHTSGIAGLVIKMGLAKDQKSANAVLIGVIVLCLLVMLAVFLVPALTPEPAVQPVRLPV